MVNGKVSLALVTMAKPVLGKRAFCTILVYRLVTTFSKAMQENTFILTYLIIFFM